MEMKALASRRSHARAAQPISSMDFQQQHKSSSPSTVSTKLKSLEATLRSFLAHSTKHIAQPASSSLLPGNLAPVAEECPPQECLSVTGNLPDVLDGGIYLRNGSNPRYFSANSGYHFFDGDGMVHAVKFQSGAASYCCRFVRTSRLEQEQVAGRQLFPKIFGELKGFHGLAEMAVLVIKSVIGSIDVTSGLGTANTGVFFVNGMLFATMETDKPHVLRIRDDGDLETLGRYDFCGKLGNAMTEVPKIDPVTREMFVFSNKLFLPPYLMYSRVSSDGVMQPGVAITTKEPALIHDFVITENYAIIPENQLAFRLGEMLTGNSPICLDQDKVPRVGILPRYATDESGIRWFPVPGLMCMHYPNAWEEEGDDVVILGVGLLSPERIMVDLDHMTCGLIEIRVNLKSGKVCKRLVCSINGEKHQINTRYLGRKNRYIYFGSGSWPKLDGMYKLDLQAELEAQRVVGYKKFEDGCYTSEPVFVPRTASGDSREDDGYLLCYLHNELNHTSELLVMDASSPSLETVATVKLPRRVPYGFHGTFISPAELSTQRPYPQVLPRHAKVSIGENLSRLLKFLIAT